jgi:hypothetical protein
VCAIAIRNQARFDVLARARRLGRAGGRVAVAGEVLRRSRSTAPTLAGPRTAGTSTAGARCTQWSEARVWAAIERHRVTPHPAYRLGWGRVSCAACIFGNPDQWASLLAVRPAQFEQVSGREKLFAKTIQRKRSVEQLAAAGKPYAAITAELSALVNAETFDEPVVVDPTAWQLPAGAFGDGRNTTVSPGSSCALVFEQHVVISSRFKTRRRSSRGRALAWRARWAVGMGGTVHPARDPNLGEGC